MVADIDALLAAKRGVSRLHKIQLQRKRAVLVDASTPKSKRERFALLTNKWIQLVVRAKASRFEVDVKPTKRMARTVSKPSVPKITAVIADRRAKGQWFRGYTSMVGLVDGTFSARDFDVPRREKKANGSEYILFDSNVKISGTLRLGSGTRSIYVILGDLSASRIELGDSVLVVRGQVSANAYIFGSANEGIFDVQGMQRPDRLVKHLKTPYFLAYDPMARKHRGEHVVFTTRGKDRVQLDNAELEPTILRKNEDGELVVDLERALARLRAGKPLDKVLSKRR